MAWWRTALLWISRFFFRSLVILTVVVAVFASFLGTPDTLKQILKDSGAYDSVVDIVLDETAKQAKEDNTIPVSDEKIQELVKDVFSAERLQEIVDNVADGTYRWLNGEVPEPDFNIDLQSEKVALAEGIADYAGERIKKLPACTSIPKTTDPFEIDCLPPGINISAEQKKIKQELLASKDFLPETSFSAQNIKNNDGQTFSEQNQQIATAYQTLMKLPWILGAAALVFGAAIVFLDRTKREGLSKVGKTLLTSGLFLLIMTFMFGKLLPISENLLKNSDQNAASEVLKKLAGLAIEKLTNGLLIYSAVVLLLGLAVLGVLRLTRPKRPKN